MWFVYDGYYEIRNQKVMMEFHGDYWNSNPNCSSTFNYVYEEMVHVRLLWILDDDFIETSGRTNVVIAAYTTAQARLKLYSYLGRYDDRILYADIY